MPKIGGRRGSRRAEDTIHLQDHDQFSGQQQQQQDNFTDHHPHRGNDFAQNSVTAFSEDPAGRAGQGSVDEVPTKSACDSPQVPGNGEELSNPDPVEASGDGWEEACQEELMFRAEERPGSGGSEAQAEARHDWIAGQDVRNETTPRWLDYGAWNREDGGQWDEQGQGDWDGRPLREDGHRGHPEAQDYAEDQGRRTERSRGGFDHRLYSGEAGGRWDGHLQFVPGSAEGAQPKQRLPTQYQPQPLSVKPLSAVQPQSSRTLDHPWHYRHDVITTSSQDTMPTGGRPRPVLKGPPSSTRPQSHTTFHHPGLNPQNVITTSSHALEMTSCRNSPVVIQPSVGAAGFGLADTSSPPNEGVIVVTTIAAFVSIFCCLCTGLAAFVVAIQAKSKKSAGQHQEARQKLWCSFALIVASLFILIPVIFLYCLRDLPSLTSHHHA